MRCVNCGNESHPPTATHCVRCGARLPAAGVPTAPAPPPVSPPPAMAAQRPGRPCPGCAVLLPVPLPDACPNCGRVLSAQPSSGAWDATRPMPQGSLLSRIPDRAFTPIGLVGGALLSALLISILGSATRPGSFARLMFLPGGVLKAIPWAITFLFFWSAIMLVLRASRLRAQQAFLRSRLATEVPRVLETEGPEAAIGLLRRERVESRSIVLRRVQRALEQWRVSGTVESVDSILRHQAELDSEVAASGYALVRLFVWAMPVLGLIGTVVGISLAVSGFSRFLGTEIGNMEVVKKQLVGVTYGLSFAFLITLDGLLGALLVMLPTAGVQKGEEDFLMAVDRYCVDEIMPRLHGKMAAASPGQVPISVDVGSRLAEVLEKHLPSANAWREQMEAFTQASLQRLTDSCSQIAAQVKAAGEGEADRLRALAEIVGAKFVEVGNQLHRDLGATQQQMSADTAKAVEEFGKLAASFGKAMQGHQEQFARTAGELGALSAQAERLAEAHKALSASLDRLAGVDSLANALVGVSAVVESMRPLLARLSGPLEFRLAPSPPSGGSGGAT